MSTRTAWGWVSVVFVLLGALAVAACGMASGGDEVVLTDQDAGSEVSLAPGQTLEVRLESNPSTGFSWEALEVPGVLKGPGAPVHEAASGDEEVVGAAGIDVFTFTAAEQDTGEGELILVYRRPWETGVEPEAEYTLSVTVR